ncbi:hypothetical protein GCM10009785_12420 [Brooklawnia cerclae]|uniref:tRNA adenosine deaminase-associated protein n=1 Tax=Brooklawnia cerclae TaxID=349934 RepID=A0ABX0SKQ8_9ACTN|nr:tRNA adenosine deaminase-associated protein [Brooklawnia cerclae]NIH58529.1 putative tRNA adenosine deaminase-associated protein [Brooklawnia cerclae]
MSEDDELIVHDDDLEEASDLDDDLDDDDELDGGVVPDDYDDDLDEEDDEDDDDDDDYEDATIEEIDFVVALYREDGAPVATELAPQLANDLDELIDQLRRLPGDAGAVGLVSIAGEFFVLCRVRGRTVQVLLNDSVAASDWPIARDVVDYLGMDVPDPDDDSEPLGDFALLADQGVSELDLENISGDLDEDSDQLVRRIVELMKFGPQFDRAVN